MFTQKCFIRKNTPELVKKLEELGYRASFSARNGYGKYLYAFDGTIVGDEYNSNDEKAGFVDCGTNDELFLAIAALRDDSDKHQFFTNGKEWIQCEKEDWIDEISSLCVGGNYNYDKNGELSLEFHKATVQELIEHFKS